MIGVYILFSPRTGKFYVGSSGDLAKRHDQHFTELRKNRHLCVGLQDLWNSGHDIFFFPVTVETREEAYALEQDILDRYRDDDKMLNVGLGVWGGDNLTRNPNREDIIRRMKAGLQTRMNLLSPIERKLIFGQPGPQNGMYGRTHTSEARKKISDANSGKVRRVGFTLSDEQKKVLSDHAKTRIGIKNPFFGKKHTEETKRTIAEAIRANGLLPTNSRKVSVDGKVYISLTEAARCLSISPGLMVYRLKRGQPGYKYIDESPETIESAQGIK